MSMLPTPSLTLVRRSTLAIVAFPLALYGQLRVPLVKAPSTATLSATCSCPPPATSTRSFLLSKSPAAVRDFLGDQSGNDALGLMGNLFATASPSSAYVSTDVISGMIERTFFSLTYARVVVRDTALGTPTKRLAANDVAALQRVINNGGSVGTRFLVPLFGARSDNAQLLSSVYPQVGVDGPLDKPDSLAFVGGVVLDSRVTMAIRTRDRTAKPIGALELGLRAGAVQSQRALLSIAGSPKGVGYLQVAVGVRQGEGQLGVEVLYTAVTNRTVLRSYYPRLMVSFSALKM